MYPTQWYRNVFFSSGVKIFEKVAIESIITDGKSITAVKTSNGTVKCEILVNCAGQVKQLGSNCSNSLQDKHICMFYYNSAQ